MKITRTLAPLLLLLTLCGSACAQAKILFSRVPQSVYDVARDPVVAERVTMNSSAATTTNGTRLQAIFDRMHTSTNGITYPVFVPFGLLYHPGDLHLGITAAETSARAGGSFTGAGSMGFSLDNNATSVNKGQETRLVDTNTTDTTPLDGIHDGASIVYGGAGFTFGNFSLFGFDITHTGDGSLAGDWTSRNNETLNPKKQYGLWIKSCGVSSIPTGYLFVGPMQFQGYETAIYISPKTGTATQGNNTYWAYIHTDNCATAFHVADNQSMSHEIYALDGGAFCERQVFVERGGDVHVRSGLVSYDNQTIVEIGDHYHHNFGDVSYDNLKIDAAAQGVLLLKLGAIVGTNYRMVRITGTVTNTSTFDAGGAVQGVVAGDKIFINFTGDPTQAAIANAFSTVDAEGNYLSKQIYVDIGTPDGAAITTGDGKAYYRVPAEINGYNLVDVDMSVDTASSSGIPTFQLRRKRAGADVDMLSTSITVDATETDSSTAAVPRVINTTNDDVATADRIYFDCDVAGTGTKAPAFTLMFQHP